MRCPFCSTNKDKVIDSRSTDGGRAIRRRRLCLACDKRFTTYEHIEAKTRLMVIKNDGSRVPYDRQKMLEGLQKACYKRKVSAETLLQLIEETEEQLFKRHEREIQSIDIGQTVAERLKRIDQVAYVRYASVYKQFKDLDDFLDEVREVLETMPEDTPGQGSLFKKG
jgi:transcriptional repressor NrdR